MSSSSPDHWSLRQSLAFLAAAFAIVFGSLAPAAVAASPATGVPLVLCSGDSLRVVYDADGQPRPVQAPEMDSLGCAMALLSDLAADERTPAECAPPPAHAPALPGPCHGVVQTAADRPKPRPPSTAPPKA